MKALVRAALLAACAWGAASAAPPLPARLADTGLFEAGSSGDVRGDAIAFAPQYPLWSDGAAKRRWLRLPAGAAIDASRADAWRFPVGTRFWKEFRHGGPIETRYIERTAAGWRYATYVWNAEGTEAVLAPEEGTVLAVREAPGGRYAVPSRSDCVACHEGSAVPVLGFSALQLSPDRDRLAPHADREAPAANLRTLAERGVLRGLPRALLDRPPRIEAASPAARAALGYLHGNCGHCHNASALDGLALRLALGASGDASPTLATLVARPSRFRPRGSDASSRVAPGEPHASVVALRMRALDPLVRMPPLGTQAVDVEGLALVERWIHELQRQTEKNP